MTNLSVLAARQLKEQLTLLPILFVVNGDGQNCHRLWCAFNCKLNISSIPTISEGTDSGCNLHSVTTGGMFMLQCLFSFGERL